MEQKPKLNLEPPDFSKAKLPLGEEPISVKIDPKLKLDSEPIGLAESAYKLSQDLAKIYENPIFGTFKKIEDDKKTLLSDLKSLSWDSESMKSKLDDLEKALHNPSISLAFKTAQDYEQFIKPILSSIEKKNSIGLAESLAMGYKQYLKPEFATAQSTLEQFRKTLENPTIQDSMSHLQNLGIYESGLAKAAASIVKNEDLFGSAKSLASLGQSIASDSLNYKRAQQSKTFPEIIKKEYAPIKIPENPLPKQNAQIISILEILKEQNDTLITINSEFLNFERSDLDIQNSIILLMQNQQTSYEIMIEELKAQNNGIETQVIELKKQNTTSADQIEDNRKSSRNTMIVAIFSILLSAYASYMSYKASYTIYHLEKNDNNVDNNNLLKTIEDKKIETQKQDQLIKLMEEQNAYLKKLAERESK